MMRIRALFTTGIVAGSALVALVSGCTDDNPGIFIRGVLAPPTSTNGTCVYTADPAQPNITAGVLDVGFAGSYSAALIVGNQLIARADPTVPRVDTSGITLQGVVVNLTDVQGKSIKTFTSVGSGFVAGSTGTSPGFGFIAANLIDPDAATTLRGEIPLHGSKGVLAQVKVFGRTTGGLTVESGQFQFPINVCNGCLVTFPPDSVDPVKAAATGKTNCSGAAPSGGFTNPCSLGQDQPVDCRLCQSNPLCDPAAP